MEEKRERYDICGQIIGAAMKVHSTLGPGFLESVYQNALIWELRKSGFKAEVERPITVCYDGEIVGAFAADEGLLLNFGTERLEFKKKFRRPAQGEEVSL